MASTVMPIRIAVGTSLVAVTAFGLTTALSYAASGLVDSTLASVFIVGGLLGGIVGSRAARPLSSRGSLSTIFAGLIFAVAPSMLVRSEERRVGQECVRPCRSRLLPEPLKQK